MSAPPSSATAGIVELSVSSLSFPIPKAPIPLSSNLNKLLSLSPRSSVRDNIKAINNNDTKPTTHSVKIQLASSNLNGTMSTVLEEITPDPTLPDQLNIAPTTKFKIPMMWLSASLAAHMPSLTLTIYRDDNIFVGSIYISPFKLSSWISPTSHALNRAASQTGTTSRVSKTQNLIDSSLSPPDGAPSTISYSLVFVPEILFDQASLLPHGGVKTSDELRPVVLTVFVVASCGFNLPEGCTRPGIMGRIGRRGKVKKDWGWWCCRQDANDTAAHDKNINESDGKDNYDNDVTNDYYYNKTFSHVVPFHVARRSFLELVAVDENENSPFARARVPVWSLVEGQGRWVDMKGIEKQVTGDGEGDNIQFESLLDAGKKENGLDSSGDEGSCWVAVGIKFEEEATPVAPTMRMTQTQTSTTAKKMTTTTTTTTTTMPSPPAEDIKDIKIPQATIPEGPKIQAPPSDTSPITFMPHGSLVRSLPDTTLVTIKRHESHRDARLTPHWSLSCIMASRVEPGTPSWSPSWPPSSVMNPIQGFRAFV